MALRESLTTSSSRRSARACARSTSAPRSTSPTPARCARVLDADPALADPRQYLAARGRPIGDTVAELCRVVVRPHRWRRSDASRADAAPGRLAGRHDRTAQVRGAASVSTPYARPIPPFWRRPSRRPPPTTATCSIEATSNQVDQFGGYTGLRPARVPRPRPRHRRRARLRPRPRRPRRRPPRPQPLAARIRRTWRWPTPRSSIAAYVEAGYTKIHLDCSMSLCRRPAPCCPTRWSPSAAPGC